MWDVCANDRVRIVDTSDGTVLAKVGLRGRPAWSADGQWLASLDDVDGTLRVAEVATGRVRVVAELGIPEYSFDSCGVSGEVLGWSSDGSSILVSYTDYSPPQRESSVEVFLVDGSDSQLLRHPRAELGKLPVTASWLNDGDVMIVAVDTAERGDVMVQRGDPWTGFPDEPVTLPRPDVQLSFSPQISAYGNRLAFATMDGVVNGARTAQTTGSVVIVDSATGESLTASSHEAYTVPYAGMASLSLMDPTSRSSSTTTLSATRRLSSLPPPTDLGRRDRRRPSPYERRLAVRRQPHGAWWRNHTEAHRPGDR